jgi:hypothetical protein
MKIEEHNKVVKSLLGEQKHFKHVMSDQQIKQMTDIEGRYPLTRLPVCGTCERLGMWDKDGTGVCKHCGATTVSPITYSAYLASGYDIDQTGATFRKIKHAQEMVKRQLLPRY